MTDFKEQSDYKNRSPRPSFALCKFLFFKLGPGPEKIYSFRSLFISEIKTAQSA